MLEISHHSPGSAGEMAVGWFPKTQEDFIFRVSGAYPVLSLILHKQPHGIWLCSPVLHLNPDYRHKVASREVDFLQWKEGPQNSSKTSPPCSGDGLRHRPSTARDLASGE